jgi:exodeoxyribonuclease-5
MTATPVGRASTNCAACAMALKDLTDAQTGLDQTCRAQFGYRKISSLPDPKRAEANAIIHAIAQDAFRGNDLRTAIFTLYEMGFTDLAKRIERRVGAATVPQTEPAPAPPAPTEAELSLVMSPSETLRPLPFQPTEDQNHALDAIRRMMKKRGHAITVVVGFAGVGKSAAILFLAHEHGAPIVITPTGRAAMRVRELTGLDAMTIHRWIYKAVEDPKTGLVEFVRKSADEIEAAVPRSRLVVLDEASMVGPDIWEDVLSIVDHHNLKLVCVGDGFQLPPVQAPNAPPFSILTPEFAAQLGAERVEMTTVLRQAQDSPVIRASMAIRNGGGVMALRKNLPTIETHQLAEVCMSVYRNDGIVICHRNATRFRVNAGIRQALGVYDEMPQLGEPLLCRKNTYSVGLMNGETFKFEGWAVPPEQIEQVHDRYKEIRETARFGAIRVGGKALATIAVEELHGRLQSGPKAIEIAAKQWARLENLYTGDNTSPHVHAQWGYCYTAHAGQGGQWPYVLVVLESTIKLGEEEGRRWIYTSITRASAMTAIHYGNV